MKPIFQHPALSRALAKANGCWFAAALLLLSTTATPAAESLSVLLQKAIFAEETEGNLDAAIKIYEGIANESDANRALVAQAQYRLGLCQIKKGKNEEAVAAFRRMISDFPSQPDLIAKSRERLLELGQPASSAIVRQLWENALPLSGSINADGRYLAFVDWNTGDLALRDLSAGQTRCLTDKVPWEKSSQFADSPVLSPDGSRVAYSWWNDEQCELRIMALAESKFRVLLTNSSVWPAAWSPDANTLAVVMGGGSGDRNIAVITPFSGNVRVIKSLGTREPSRVCFSPDGRAMAYSCRRETTWESAVFVIDLKTGTQTAAVEHPSDEVLLGWSSAGMLLSSDRNGSPGLWHLPMTPDNQAGGELVLVKSDLGRVDPLGFNHAGTFYYGVSGISSTLYEAAIDLSSGKLVSGPRELPSRLNVPKSMGPKRLSPDGQLHAFSQNRGSRRVFSLEDFRTGQIREIGLPGVREFFYPVWSPDSQFFVVRGVSYGEQNGLYLFDRGSSAMRMLEVSESGSNVEYGWMGFEGGSVRYSVANSNATTLVWLDLKTQAKREQQLGTLPAGTEPTHRLSPDGNQLFSILKRQTEPGTTNWLGICHDFKSGDEFEFLRSTNRFYFTLDPRPDRPLVVTMEWNSNERPTVKGIQVIGRSAKELFSINLPERMLMWPHWIGDSSRLLFTTTAMNRVTDVWILSADAGQYKKTELAMPRMRIVGNYGVNQLLVEKSTLVPNTLWVMENFLPIASSSK